MKAQSLVTDRLFLCCSQRGPGAPLFPPFRRAHPRGHNMSSAYYHNLMYVGLRTSDTLHKKPCCIGPGLCAIHPSAWNINSANFAFWGFSEVRMQAPAFQRRLQRNGAKVGLRAMKGV